MEDGEQVLKACMERFYYTRCYSSLEFLCALKVPMSSFVTLVVGVD